jgi:bacterioferritin-associated ferredoxin
MYVCICNAVTDHQIRAAADRGVSTLDALAAETGCGTTCGCCREFALRILEDNAIPGGAFLSAAA